MSQAEKLLPAIESQVILPLLLELEGEAGQSIAVKVSVAFLGQVVIHEVRTRQIMPTDAVGGEVRLILREGGAKGDFNFSGEAILKGLSPGSGFSGFSIRGKLHSGNDAQSARLTARTNRYNVWSWSKDFVF